MGYYAPTIGTVKFMPSPDPRVPNALFTLTAERAATAAFFFDFDGVLAPIKDDPAAVWPVPGVLEALAELDRLVSRVAVVSARPAEFLRGRFTTLPEIAVFGLYGLEVQRGAGPVETHPDAAPYAEVMAGIAERARVELPEGALVEYKRLAVALHYRTVPALREAVERWAAERAEEYGLRAQPGRMVVELKPPTGRDKGSVIREQTDGLTCAWYFGDDVSDRRAFLALDERESADPGFTGVRVAVANPETGAELADAADLRLDSPQQVPTLLAEVISVLRG